MDDRLGGVVCDALDGEFGVHDGVDGGMIPHIAIGGYLQGFGIGMRRCRYQWIRVWHKDIICDK